MPSPYSLNSTRQKIFSIQMKSLFFVDVYPTKLAFSKMANTQVLNDRGKINRVSESKYGDPTRYKLWIIGVLLKSNIIGDS